MEQHEHHERRRPVIEHLQREVVDAYVGMLERLNADIAFQLRRAPEVNKGLVFQVPLPALASSDLRKADAGPAASSPKKSKPAKSAKAPPKVAAATPATGEPRKIKAPGSRGGKWYRDEDGNVRYGTKPIGRFKRALKEHEEADLYKNLHVVIGDIHGTHLLGLAKTMEVDPGVLETLKDSVAIALSEGVSVEDAFVEQAVCGQGLDPEVDEEAVDRAHELLSNLANAYHQAVQSPQYRKLAQDALANIRQQAVQLERTVASQKKHTDGHFDRMLSGDVGTESTKLLAMMHELGLFMMPETAAEARKYLDDENDVQHAIGSVLTNPDRYNALLEGAENLSPEQQLGLTAAIICIGSEENEQKGEGERDAYWKRAQAKGAGINVIQRLRDWMSAGGRDFSDAEWDLVASRTVEMSKHVADIVHAKNHNQGGHAFTALFHKTTSCKELFTDDAAASRLKDLEAEKKLRIERALRAQTDYTAKSDAKVENNLAKTGRDLFSFQRAAIAWMSEIKRGILAYDAGLGKTPIAIAATSKLIDEGKIKRGIMVLPANLMEQWPQEIQNYRPGSKVVVIKAGSGAAAEDETAIDDRVRVLRAINDGTIDADFVVISTGTIDFHPSTKRTLEEKVGEFAEQAKVKKVSAKARQDLIDQHNLLGTDPLVQELKKLDGMMVFDEIHTLGLKSPTTMHRQIAEEVLAGREYAFGMTATPMTQGISDLFHLSNLFHPGSAGESVSRFERRIVKYERRFDPDSGQMISVPVDADLQQLREAKKDIKPFVFFQRKTSELVTSEMAKTGRKLPKLVPVMHALSLEGRALDLYNKCSERGFDEAHEPYRPRGEDYRTDNELYDAISKTDGPAAAEAALRMRMYNRKQRCAISPRLVDKSYKGPQPKIDSTCDLIKRHFNDPKNHDSPCVVFSSWLDSLDLTSEALQAEGMGIPKHQIGFITGEMSQAERDAVQTAVNNGDIKVVLIGIKAGGAGLNLQKKAFRSIYLDKPWTPSDMEQTLGRVWRTGNPNEQVYAHHIKVTGSTDERKYSQLTERAKTLDALAFADSDDAQLSGTVQASILRVAGTLDEDVKEWTPEQEKAALQMAGLTAGDVSPLDKIDALKNNFDLKEARKKIKADKFREHGEHVLKNKAALNDLRLHDGIISRDEWEKSRRRIANGAKRWASLVNAAEDHPIAEFIDEQLNWASEGDQAIMHSRQETVARRKRSPKAEAKRLENKVTALPLPRQKAKRKAS